ncbi:MAG: TatD DNase family protein [Verrucomicrobiales bacterium]|jgi:TatD DNase family protein
MLIDTHCHLASSKFAAAEVGEIVKRATEAGVTRIIAIGTTLEDSHANVALAERYEQVYAAVGIHPTDVLELPPGEDWLRELRELTLHPKVVAIGEIGLDYFHPPAEGTVDDYHRRQAEVFRQQLELAAELGYNVVVHQRESYAATVAAVQPFNGKLRAVFHCFTGSAEQAAVLQANDHLVSFTGIVTFKNAADVQECAKSVAVGSFMVETDAPYLAPMPYRGKRCEPAFARNTADHIAALRGIDSETLAAETTATAEAFFRFPVLA